MVGQGLANMIGNAITGGGPSVGGSGGAFTNQYSCDFDGVDGYIELGNPPALQFTSSFSISLWFKSTDTSDYILICKDKTNGNLTTERSWALWGNRFGGTNVINFNVRSGSSAFTVQSTSDYNDGNWHHVVATYESSTAIKVYVDGALENTNTTSIPATINNVSTEVNIGRAINSLYFMDGKVDEVGLFNGVLSASDVTAIYNSSNPQSLDSYSPLGWWRNGDNNGGTGTTVTDEGSGGNNGILINSASFNTDAP